VQRHGVGDGAVAVEQIRLEVARRDGEFVGQYPVYLLAQTLVSQGELAGMAVHLFAKLPTRPSFPTSGITHYL
jgi:hypothetical protein